YLVLGKAVHGNAVPVAIDHRGELYEWFQSLPLQRVAPFLEEAPRPCRAGVIPQLAERLLEQVGSVQPLVRRQERLERLATVGGEVLPVRQQRVLLALDEASVRTRKPCVFGLSHLVQRLAEVPHDVELVEKD